MSKQNNSMKLIMENFRKLIETEEVSPAREIGPANLGPQFGADYWVPADGCPAAPLPTMTLRGRIELARQCAHGCWKGAEYCSMLKKRKQDYLNYIYVDQQTSSVLNEASELINEERTVSTQTQVGDITGLWTPDEECTVSAPTLTLRGRINTGRMCAHGCSTVTEVMCSNLARNHSDYKEFVYEESEDEELDDEIDDLTDRAQDGTEITEDNVVEHVKNGTWVKEGEQARPFPNASKIVVKGVFKLQQFLDVRTDGVIGRETMRALRNKYYGN